LYRYKMAVKEEEETKNSSLPPRPDHSLQTLDLSGCAGVQSGVLLRLLRHTGLDNRPRDPRDGWASSGALEKLGLAGCDVVWL
jgi:hypothetical protein